MCLLGRRRHSPLRPAHTAQRKPGAGQLHCPASRGRTEATAGTALLGTLCPGVFFRVPRSLGRLPGHESWGPGFPTSSLCQTRPFSGVCGGSRNTSFPCGRWPCAPGPCQSPGLPPHLCGRTQLSLGPCVLVGPPAGRPGSQSHLCVCRQLTQLLQPSSSLIGKAVTLLMPVSDGRAAKWEIGGRSESCCLRAHPCSPGRQGEVACSGSQGRWHQSWQRPRSLDRSPPRATGSAFHPHSHPHLSLPPHFPLSLSLTLQQTELCP